LDVKVSYQTGNQATLTETDMKTDFNSTAVSKTYISIGPELYGEMGYKLSCIHEGISNADEDCYTKADIFELKKDKVELTSESYDRVNTTADMIEVDGLNKYRSLWKEIKEFYIECGTAIPFDREAWNKGYIQCTGGLKNLIWFKHGGIEYTFDRHPDFETRTEPEQP